MSISSIRRKARKARIEESELDEGLQTYHPPLAEEGGPEEISRSGGRRERLGVALSLTIPTRIRIGICTNICAYVHMYVYVYMYAYLYVYV